MMSLSEAIRLGAMLHPQAFGYSHQAKDGTVRTCALGAAFDAGWIWMSERQQPRARCPICPGLVGEIVPVVTHLNDWHRWTREQIADWVETVENKDAAFHDDATSRIGLLAR